VQRDAVPLGALDGGDAELFQLAVAQGGFHLLLAAHRAGPVYLADHAGR
jgi:hypothetical protein